jgi:hypothetical protein
MLAKSQSEPLNHRAPAESSPRTADALEPKTTEHVKGREVGSAAELRKVPEALSEKEPRTGEEASSASEETVPVPAQERER